MFLKVTCKGSVLVKLAEEGEEEIYSNQLDLQPILTAVDFEIINSNNLTIKVSGRCSYFPRV